VLELLGAIEGRGPWGMFLFCFFAIENLLDFMKGL
jgi:hypothetical protein